MHDADQPRLTHVDGRPMWVASDGRMVPHVCGGDGPDEPPAPGSPPANPPAAPPVPPIPPSTPPVDVDAITAAATAAAEANFKAWLDEQAAAAEREQMSEADRKVAEAAAATATAAATNAAAAQAALDAQLTIALVAAGLQLPAAPAEGVDGPNPQDVLATHVRSLGLTPGATPEQIAKALATHRAAFEAAYAAPAPAPGTPPAPGLNPPKPPAGGGTPTTAMERGRERARQSKPAPTEGDKFAALRSA